MSIVYTQIEMYLAKNEKLFARAIRESNPGLWSYKNDLRTPMFKLEGLCRIYGNANASRRLAKINDRFKKLEDSLGLLDYYSAFENEFSENKKVPVIIKEFLHGQSTLATKALNDLLDTEGWLSGIRLKKIRSRLPKIEWIEKESKEINSLQESYRSEIKIIEDFASRTRFEFKNVEADLHEMRRRLRWLSIYPQALGGIMVLEETKPMNSNLKKYLTPEIIDSRFNRLPVSNTIKTHIVLEKNTFLSLSWMISTLGRIKDQGLRLLLLEEAFKKTKLFPADKIQGEIKNILGNDYPSIQVLLKQSSEICKTYFEEKNLDRLILK